MKLGVFGGTFDPPHVGHLIVAGDAAEALGLDRVLWIPAAVSPFKQHLAGTPAELRLEMVRAAVAGDPRFEVDALEVEREGPSYTADTLRELRERRPDAELHLLLGADAARDLPKWREPDAIVRLACICVLSRAGEAKVDAPFPVTQVEVTRVDVSATDLRARVATGGSVRHLVPDGVRTIIEREGLYRHGSEGSRDARRAPRDQPAKNPGTLPATEPIADSR